MTAADKARSSTAAAALAAFIQQGDKLTGGGETGKGDFGWSVAISADGTTALVGAPEDDLNRGAAWIFARSGSEWHQQGSKLTGSGGTALARFGSSVALSADGSTALIGGSGDDGSKGAAWVFTRSGSAWNQQGGKLSGSGAAGNATFGVDVAVSADGSTALIGGAFDGLGKGAAWVFTRSGSAWNQQGGKLTGNDETGLGRFASSVALSAEGSTALIGGPSDDGSKGAAWVFTRSGSAWNQQGGKLIASEAGTQTFGADVALSADGSTALIGSYQSLAAWVFTRSGSVWSQQGGRLRSDETGPAGMATSFGTSVALSAAGTTALIGGPGTDDGKGAAWVFTRSGSTWTQQGGKFSGATGKANFGWSVAVSGDGNTALIGGYLDNNEQGAAWVFSSAPPAVSGISPGSGPAAGGTVVTIKGTGFSGATDVKFGSAASPLVKVVSDGELNVVSPPGQAGTVDVTVAGPTGTSPANASAKFTYTGQTTTTTTTATTTPTTTATITKIVFAKTIGSGKARLLDVRIRVTGKGKVKLRLLRKGVAKLQRTYPVRSGANELMAVIPRTLARGTYQISITLTDAKGRQKVYKSSVVVPA